MKLDEIDLKLINLLQEDSNRPIKELAKHLNLTIGPVHERIKKLERANIIKKYVALVDPKALNKNLITYCAVSVEKHKQYQFNGFEEKIKEMDEVVECYTIAGNHDYLLKIISGSMDDYQDFVMNKLSKLEMILHVNSQFVIKHVKYTTAIKV
ncbi:MAG: Lrp/AsnC family transcriptional regulator [Flavobacteriales bacterium]|nr:Lrp/AsnC family transcriptional regulator [Flavobacteriales bacterium]MCB9363366.1 Lrp/AsnC family transcriptional regulator [Flavobacteriales bacterium]